MEIVIKGGEMDLEEQRKYYEYALSKEPNCYQLDVEIDGEYVNLTYHIKNPKFDRIRRITGYLVGTLDRFNDGKKAEEKSRVKHNIEER